MPLCVDLDGTLITSNSLIQSLFDLVRRNPLNVLTVLGWSLRGRALLKKRTAERVELEAASLPYNHELLVYLRAEYSRGRRLVLCTGADEQIARNVANHLGIFSTVLSSDGKQNLKGRAKARVLERCFGIRRFDYAGDSWADLAVWRRSHLAIVVNASPWTVLALRLLGVSISRSFSGRVP